MLLKIFTDPYLVTLVEPVFTCLFLLHKEDIVRLEEEAKKKKKLMTIFFSIFNKRESFG